MGNPVGIQPKETGSGLIQLKRIVTCKKPFYRRIAGRTAQMVLAEPHACIHESKVRDKIGIQFPDRLLHSGMESGFFP